MSIKEKFQSLAQKAFGLSQLAQMWKMGLDLPESGGSKPTRPYAQVALVFTCIEKLISSISGLPLVLSTVDEKLIESGPAYDLLFNNPSLSWQQLVINTIGHYALTRDVFWVFTDTAGTQPKKIMVVSGTQMHPVTSNGMASGMLIGWELRGIGGQRAKFPLDEVYQLKNFNPYDRFHGLGPLKAAELNINYSFAADLYNSSALANGAEPGAILTAPGKLDDDTVRMIRSQFDARHKGASKTKRTALLAGGLDIKTIAMKMTDMQVARLTEMSDKKICSAFGVPPGVAGLITEAQYSHGPAMEDFIFNTVLPLANLFAGEITAGILSRFSASKWLGGGFDAVELKDARFYAGSRNRLLSKNVYFRSARHKAVAVQKKAFAWFDLGQHPVVREHQRKVSEQVIKFTDAGVPLNDIIEVHDLPYQQVDWGNDWWIGMGQVPARYALEAGLEGLTGPSMPEGEEEPKSIRNSQITKDNEQRATSDEQRNLRIWRNWYISWAGIEKEYTEAMRKFFLRQQRILTDKLKAALSEQRATSNKQRAVSDEIIARIVFDLKVENEKIKVINTIFFEKASELGIRQSLSEILGLTGDKLDEAAGRAKRMPFVKGKRLISTQKITGINQTTQRLVADQLSSGLDAGEGLNELTDRIKTVFGFERNRALKIARTQTAGAVGTGRHAGMKGAGVELKAWLTSGDPQVRDSHVEAGQTYTEGIALDMPFIVGGESLMYPGDPSGSAGNIINCRCVEIARLAAGKSFGLDYYGNLKFYSYLDMQKSPAPPDKKSEVKNAD